MAVVRLRVGVHASTRDWQWTNQAAHLLLKRVPVVYETFKFPRARGQTPPGG